MRILLRGGSIAAGKGVAVCYADILKRELDSGDIEFINRSYVGDTTFEGVWTFDRDIEPYRPDLLILHFGIDDVYRPVYRSEFKENLVQLVRLARSMFSTHIFLLTSQYFEDIYEMDAVNIYYRAIRDVAMDLGCEYIPIHVLWINYSHDKWNKEKRLVHDDGRYPNEEGHKIFAEAVLRRIDRYLSV